MCGILVYKDHGDNSRIRLRGQDHTNKVVIGGMTFVHNLLWVTGDFTPQPYVDVDDGIVCVYNGEIYNHRYVHSDGEVLIPLYKEHGPTFARHLDGEFAIAIYDFRLGVAVFSTDPFGTKPLFVRGAECASYRSGVGGERLGPNKMRFVSLPDGKTLYEDDLHPWRFDRQNVDSYDAWIAAFEGAIRKRAVDGCFLGLSSGYDSGAIACALLKAGTGFKAYAYRGKESVDVLDKRLRLVKQHQVFDPKPHVMKFLRETYLPKDNEPYTIYYKGIPTSMKLLDDGGIVGVGTYSELAHKEGRKVALSGQGGDEIMSDYSLYPSQSELKGRFPKDLSKWRNFDRGCQESYLLKEEYAGGAYSIETRYPFLDKEVVQAFLDLTPAAKNRYYKAPVREYLLRHQFPFKEGVKIGFSVDLKEAMNL